MAILLGTMLLGAEGSADGTLISVLLGAIGALSGALGTYLARRYRMQSARAVTEQQRLFAQNGQLVSWLQRYVRQLLSEFKEIQQHYLDCRLHNAALPARVAELERQLPSRPREVGDGTGDDADPGHRVGPGDDATP